MARNNSNSTLKFVGAATAAIVGGIAIGYLFGGAHTPRPAEPVVEQPTPVVSTPTSSLKPPTIRPRATNGNYTAPGAPHIVIQEEKTPILRRVARTAPPETTDPEAPQEAAPPVKPNKPAAPVKPSDAAPSDTSTTPTPTTPTDTSAPPATDNSGSSTPPSAPTAPSDPDFEHVGKPADPESNQQGGGKAQFRVQTGSYTDESKARSDADALRSEGFTTSTRSEREGDHMVYKVQVGAYKSRAGASKAADDLQKKGYPAYVSPIAP